MSVSNPLASTAVTVRSRATWPALVAVGASLLALVPSAQAATGTPRYDVVIQGGMVVDGTGSEPRPADVAVDDGYIVKVGELGPYEADRLIDARQHFVTPGFINIHDHSQPDALPTAENMLTQGVTTAIINADGVGAIDIAAQLSDLSQRPLAINVGAAGGFNSIWDAVIGAQRRRPSPDEIARMKALLERQQADGAWAVTAGLDYKPAYFATQADVTEIVSAARRWRTNFSNHDRLTPENGMSSVAAVQETIDIGVAAGLLPVATHVKAQGTDQGRGAEITSALAGPYTPARYAVGDVYPYLAGMTALSQLLLPAWAQEGGRDAMLARFADPGLKARISSETEAIMKSRFNGPNGVYVIDKKAELTALMAQDGLTAGDMVIRLLTESEMAVILRFGREEDVVTFMQYPNMVMACDCGADLGTGGHPRQYGSFPRVLGRYVREQKIMRWGDAIRKMTGLPASVIGMVDRGFLQPGMVADIVVLNPAIVIDRATFERPALRSIGIRDVLIGGRPSVAAGAVTGEAAGRALYRKSFMPSRPETRNDRLLIGSAADSGGVLDVAITQTGAAAQARGKLTLSSKSGAPLIAAIEPGALQQSGGWYSLTGIVSAGLMAGQAFVLIVDNADPLNPSGGVQAILMTGGRVIYRSPFMTGQQ